MRPGSVLAALGVAVSLLAVACPAARPTLTVRVQSGLRAGYEIGYVDARLVRGTASCGGDPASIGSDGLALAHADQHALGEGTLTVAEFHDLEPGIYTVRARFRRPPESSALSADSGPVLVERCLVTTLSSSRVVRIAVTTDCLTLSCPRPGGDATHTQCLNGRCTDPGCDPDDPGTAELCCDGTMTGPDCDPRVTLCDLGSDCLPVAPCALDRGCLDGVCVEPDGDRCGAGQYCSVTVGACVSIDGSTAMDAGLPDAPPPVPDAAATMDAPTAPDAPDPADAFVAPDAPVDVFLSPDAFTPRDAFAVPDAPVDAYAGPDAFVCGGTGQPCCASSSCSGSRVCVSGTCRACGSTGQPCCTGSTCSGSRVCSAGSCVVCGAAGQPCCAGSSCGGGAVCSGGSCVACGSPGQPCCGGSTCNAGAVCGGASCIACGGFFQPCCAGGACNAGLGCDGGGCTCRGYAQDCSTIPCCSGHLCGASSGGGCCATRDEWCNPADGSIYCCGTDWCCDQGGGEGRCRAQFSC